MNVSAPRQRLPNRRSHWLYRFESGGQMYTGGKNWSEQYGIGCKIAGRSSAWIKALSPFRLFPLGRHVHAAEHGLEDAILPGPLWGQASPVWEAGILPLNRHRDL